MGGMLGVDLPSVPRGIDGCGLVTYGTPLAAIARGFSAANADPAFRRCQDAIAAHPQRARNAQGAFSRTIRRML